MAKKKKPQKKSKVTEVQPDIENSKIDPVESTNTVKDITQPDSIKIETDDKKQDIILDEDTKRVYNLEDLQKMTAAQLKSECKTNNLNISGTKKVLIQRLFDFSSSTEPQKTKGKRTISSEEEKETGIVSQPKKKKPKTEAKGKKTASSEKEEKEEKKEEENEVLETDTVSQPKKKKPKTEQKKKATQRLPVSKTKTIPSSPGTSKPNTDLPHKTELAISSDSLQDLIHDSTSITDADDKSKIDNKDIATSESEKIDSELYNDATNTLRVDNFKRPFRVKSAEELFAASGSVTHFWMNSIRSHCYVAYENIQQAITAYRNINDLLWPPEGESRLVAQFVQFKELEESQKGKVPRPEMAKLREEAQVIEVKKKVEKKDEEEPLVKEDTKIDSTETQNETPTVVLDRVFRRTVTQPFIYWLPLTENQASDREKRSILNIHPDRRRQLDERLKNHLKDTRRR